MTSPTHRPPLALRAVFALGGLGVAVFNALLMLSDRAPGLLRRVGGDVVRRLFERIDLGGRGADVLEDPRLPPDDTIVHMAVWAAATVVIGLAVWSWIGLAAGALVVFAGTVLVEYLQGTVTISRQVEASDVKANLAGVVAGTVAAAGCYLLYSALATLFCRRPYPEV